jgi:hypothetical protein
MIVRERFDFYVLIKQHEHGLISGEFARHWGEKPLPLEPTLYAIANHDTGWQALDAFVRWNEQTDGPYSFTNYPIKPKLRAYNNGLDFLEAREPYAACLGSMHYASLAGDSEDEIRFQESEAGRQRKIKSAIDREEADNLGYNFRLLQLCDNLSLFVCLNEPGRNDHPWYRDGFSFEGTKLRPVWEDRHTFGLDPNPFSEPFDLVIPYTLIEKSGRRLRSDRLELRVTC